MKINEVICLRASTHRVCLAALLMLLAINPTLAQTKGAPGKPPDGFGLGVLIASRSPVYIGEDRNNLLLPIVSYRKGPWFISSRGLNYQINNAFGIGLALRNSAIKDSDAAELAGLDRNLTADLTASIQLRGGPVLWRALATQEVTKEHDGQSLVLSATLPMPIPAVRMGLEVGAVWESEKLRMYQYGLTDLEASQNLTAYDPSSGWTPFLGIQVNKKLTDRWTLLGQARMEWFEQEITNSPLVEHKQFSRLSLGVWYNF